MSLPISTGDWHLRGRDVETALIGPVTERIIDAARLVREAGANGFPNYELYRVCLAGDSLGVKKLRQWCVAFAVAHASTGGVKASAYSDELAATAGWDALHMMMYSRPIIPYSVAAAAFGVHAVTYKRLRNALYSRLHLSLYDYWVELMIAYLQVIKKEREVKN